MRINSFRFNEAKTFSPRTEAFRAQKSEYLSPVKAEHFILWSLLVFFKMPRFSKRGKIRLCVMLNNYPWQKYKNIYVLITILVIAFFFSARNWEVKEIQFLFCESFDKTCLMNKSLLRVCYKISAELPQTSWHYQGAAQEQGAAQRRSKSKMKKRV